MKIAAPQTFLLWINCQVLLIILFEYQVLVLQIYDGLHNLK